MARTKKPVPPAESPVLGTLIAAPPAVSKEVPLSEAFTTAEPPETYDKPSTLPQLSKFLASEGMGLDLTEHSAPLIPAHHDIMPVVAPTSDFAGLAARSVAEWPMPSERTPTETANYIKSLEDGCASLNATIAEQRERISNLEAEVREYERATTCRYCGFPDYAYRSINDDGCRTVCLVCGDIDDYTVPNPKLLAYSAEIRDAYHANPTAPKYAASWVERIVQHATEKRDQRIAELESIVNDATVLYPSEVATIEASMSRAGIGVGSVADRVERMSLYLCDAKERATRTPSDDFATYQRVTTGRLKFGQWRGNTLVDPVSGSIVGQVAPEVPAPGVAAKAWTCSVVLGDQQAAGPKGTEADARAWVERMSGRGIV